MRVFVCEYVTGGGFVGTHLPSGLRREGDMMLHALVKDLTGISGIEVTVARDRRLPAPDCPGPVVWVDDSDDPWLRWQVALADADALWPIAPETDGLLERLTRLAQDSRRAVLGSTPEAIRLTASKQRSTEHLARHGIAAARAMGLRDALVAGLPDAKAGWVVKPDDGAGAETTLLFRDALQLRQWAATAPDIERLVIQAYLPGQATSLSLLCRDGEAAVLCCNLQNVALAGDQFHYRGGKVGGAEDRRGLYAPIANAIAAAIPGLWGYVGVDLVETAGGPVVLEINPRLTTSYAGLAGAINANPAALVLEMLTRSPHEMALPRPSQIRPVEVRTDA